MPFNGVLVVRPGLYFKIFIFKIDKNEYLIKAHRSMFTCL